MSAFDRHDTTGASYKKGPVQYNSWNNQRLLPAGTVLPVLPVSGHDKIERPAHYCRGKYEVIDCIASLVTGMDAFEAYCCGNVIKYIGRFKHKNGKEDLQKAKRYLEMLLERL